MRQYAVICQKGKNMRVPHKNMRPRISRGPECANYVVCLSDAVMRFYAVLEQIFLMACCIGNLYGEEQKIKEGVTEEEKRSSPVPTSLQMLLVGLNSRKSQLGVDSNFLEEKEDEKSELQSKKSRTTDTQTTEPIIEEPESSSSIVVGASLIVSLTSSFF